jgi:hypothetical protein
LAIQPKKLYLKTEALKSVKQKENNRKQQEGKNKIIYASLLNQNFGCSINTKNSQQNSNNVGCFVRVVYYSTFTNCYVNIKDEIFTIHHQVASPIKA